MAYKYRISTTCKEWAIGREWTFARFTRRVWQDFAKFGRTLLPDPMKVALEAIKEATVVDGETVRTIMAKDAAEIDAANREGRHPQLLLGMFRGLSDTLAEKTLQKSTSYLSAQSPELAGLLSSHEGGAYLFWMLLKPAHPDITEDDAYDCYWDLHTNAGEDGRQTIAQIISVCNGTAPEPEKNGLPPAG